jgi:hypothetical protein
MRRLAGNDRSTGDATAVLVPSAPHTAVGWLAIAVGVVALASAACLALFFLAGNPFGIINDLGNGAVGVLSALLAWRLRGSEVSRLAGAQAAAVGSAVLGAAVTVVGSALVVSGATGFFLAGLVSSVGFGFIGLWLIALNWSNRWYERPSRWFPAAGVVTGVVMATGLTTLPGIALRLDDMAAAPSWIWIGFLGWLGVYIIYPVWSVWLGRTLLNGTRGRD